MTEIIGSIDEAAGYSVLLCDLWGCLHDGVRAFPDAVAALERFRAGGGRVVLLTNSPRPAGEVARQLDLLGAPRSCWDAVVSSGDAAQAAMAAGQFGRRVYHVGPERDLPFFRYADGRPIEVERVPLEEADGIVCTGLFDDRSETPDDYRAMILYGKTKGLKLLCANPDIVVDVGDRRIYCAGAIAAAYAAAGGRSYYFGKPHPPIYALARARLREIAGFETPTDEILASATASPPTSRARWARASTRCSSPAASPPGRPAPPPTPGRGPTGSPSTWPRRGWRRGSRWRSCDERAARKFQIGASSD